VYIVVLFVYIVVLFVYVVGLICVCSGSYLLHLFLILTCFKYINVIYFPIYLPENLFSLGFHFMDFFSSKKQMKTNIQH